MSKASTISPEILRQLLSYDEETGLLHWRVRDASWFKTNARCLSWNKVYAGKCAGTLYKVTGYVGVTVLGIRMLAHRVAYAIMSGTYPEDQIDHINGNRADNRWSNLRPVTAVENRRNMTRLRNANTGVVGVGFTDNRWVASIRGIDGKAVRIGSYLTLHEAKIARRAAEKVLGYHQNHGRAA